MKFFEDNPFLLIIDEGHLGRNDSQQNNSVGAIIRAARRAFVNKGNKGAYIGILTATPLNKSNQAASYFKLLGRHDPVKFHDMVVRPGTMSYATCYREAFRYNSKEAKEIAKKYNALDFKGKLTRPKNEQDFIADLWIDCVLKTTQSAVPDMTRKILCNAFFDIEDDEDLENIEKAHSILKDIQRLQKEGKSDIAMGKQTQVRQYSERGMCRAMTEAAYRKLKADKDNKIILVFKFVETVEKSYKMLLSLGVRENSIGMIKGSGESDAGKTTATRKKEKYSHIEKFQRSRSFRALIMIDKHGTSVGLHDLIGERQRFLFICMNDDMTTQEQVVGRVGRVGTQSIPIIFICYPTQMGPDALKIFSRNVKKSKLERRALEAINDTHWTEEDKEMFKIGIRLPGEYDRYFDPPSEKFTDRAFLWDSPIWTPKGLFPPANKHGFVERDTKENRRLYNDTKYMIEYVRSIWEQDIKADEINGIVFLPIIEKSYNQFPVSEYPSIRLLEEIP